MPVGSGLRARVVKPSHIRYGDMNCYSIFPHFEKKGETPVIKNVLWLLPDVVETLKTTYQAKGSNFCTQNLEL